MQPQLMAGLRGFLTSDLLSVLPFQPPNDPHGIQREDLILSLRAVLASTPQFAEVGSSLNTPLFPEHRLHFIVLQLPLWLRGTGTAGTRSMH